MKNKAKLLTISLCVASLSACNSLYNNQTYTQKYPVKKHDSSIQLYPDGYDNGGAYAPDDIDAPKNTGGATSDMGNPTIPVSFKERDKSWVGKQNPQGYTIEIANGDKPSDVAMSLQKAPKNERTAEVKYQQNGKQYYKGVYGSYPTYEAAQQALNALPEDMKKGATVKTWGNIQSVNE